MIPGASNRSVKMIILRVVCIMALIFTVTGCSGTKQIESEDMTIELPRGYKESELEQATWYYTSQDGLAMGIRVLKSDLEKSGLELDTLRDYVQTYISANDISGASDIKERTSPDTGNTYEYFEYEKTISRTGYSYITFFFDDGDYYWVVNFACYKAMYSEMKPEFKSSADSVTFTEQKQDD